MAETAAKSVKASDLRAGMKIRVGDHIIIVAEAHTIGPTTALRLRLPGEVRTQNRQVPADREFERA